MDDDRHPTALFFDEFVCQVALNFCSTYENSTPLGDELVEEIRRAIATWTPKDPLADDEARRHANARLKREDPRAANRNRIFIWILFRFPVHVSRGFTTRSSKLWKKADTLQGVEIYRERL